MPNTPSLKNRRVYEALRRKGMPKGQAAAISNAQVKKDSGVTGMAIAPTGAHALFNNFGLESRRKRRKQKACTCTEKASGAPGELLSPGVRRIRGNLCNVHGKYGPCDKALSGKGKPKKGRQPAKAKRTPEQRAAERTAAHDTNADSVAQRMADSDTGLSPSGSKALLAFAKGTPPDAAAGDAFTKMGLAEQASDGSYRMTPTGRAVVSAMRAGDYQRAVDAISRATDQAGKRTERQAAATARQETATARRTEVATRRAASAAERAKRQAKKPGGGSKKPAAHAAEKPRASIRSRRRGTAGASSGAGSSAAAPKPKKPVEVKPEKAPPPQIAQPLKDAATALAEGGDVSLEQIQQLITTGLAKLNKDGMIVLTAAGLRATMKAQTASERAMFAKMGGGGSGGSGGSGGAGGAGASGGTKLWNKGPDGKRVPQAGFASGKRTPATGESKGRAADAGKPAHGQTVGVSTKAYGNDPNQSYTMHHELVDMGDIQASNTAGGGINPKYDASLQPRDRSRASSQAQIAQVAQNMNPEVMTTDFHRIDAGTPIIDAHGNVLSGNGRTLALQRAAELHPDKYDAYKAQIKAEARAAGIDPAAVDKMKNPVLVRRLEGDHDAAAFAREANSSGTLRMSPLEQAKVDAGQISDRHMLKLNAHDTGDIDRALRDKSNKPFVDEFLASVPDNERANLLTRTGELNQMGLYRVKAAVYTRAFPGEAGHRMAESMLESLDPDIKTVQNGINGALPSFSRATSLARSGMRDPNLDLSHDFAKTIDVYARIKDNPSLTHGTPANQLVAKYLGQSSMFDRELNHDQERLLVHIDKIARKPTEVRGFMERYARMVEQSPQPGQHNLFGEGHAMTRAQLLDALLGNEALPDIQQQQGLF